MKKIKKNKSLSLGQSVILLVAGIIMGCIFTFGVQYWNREVTKESCTTVKTQFLDYHIIKNRSGIREIAIDCSDSNRYFIDGVLISDEVKNDLSQLQYNDEIILLLHPNSASVVEFSIRNATLINFDEAIDNLGNEATAFLYLGVFMYLGALLGLIYTVLNIVKIRKT